ncbi:hypothetical protein SISNIDRAFT_471788 [Sistotremastrum niveocremeum HHB9708]|uniref:Uncharacterized protein n=1 Tax=Sistotremastrum niveocremeum HHB9708 TaxID=1314777 RepID=A0A164M7D4_9AGAM|nr:hypothetical protein SISNIDRAFT_471788 [Sistotremastrum niveocremeum HHB9708]
MPHDPKNNFVRLTDQQCTVVPGSLIDFRPRTDIVGSQKELLQTLNSICFRNEYTIKLKLESLLFEGNAVAQIPHGLGKHTWLFISKDIVDPLLTSPRPVTLVVWDKPSPEEMKRPTFRDCTHTLRISSSLPPIHCYSPSSWTSDITVRALLGLRSFDAHIKVLNVCVCLGIKGGSVLERHRNALLDLIDNDSQSSFMSWKRHGKVLFKADQKHIQKITVAHLTECITATHWMKNVERVQASSCLVNQMESKLWQSSFDGVMPLPNF